MPGVDGLAPLAAVLAAAAVFGGMLFFAFVMAPLIFTKLPGEVAARFIRQVFPVYYLAMGAASALAALLAALGHPVEAAVLAVVAAGFLAARQALVPRINALRDAHLAGDGAAGPRFERLHRVGVWLNGAQLVAVAVVLVRLSAAA